MSDLLLRRVNSQHQQKYTLHILTHDELAHSPLLHPLVHMQNIAYARALRQPVLPPNTTRYSGIEQYLGDSGEGATTFVQTSQFKSTTRSNCETGAETVPVIYGAVSIAPYVVSELPPANVAVPPARREFKWTPQAPARNAETRSQWLLCCLAVNPTVQRQGLAGQLVALAEAYAVAQSRGNGKVHVRVMLSCIKETTGEFYLRRGYHVADERRMPRGFFGSEGGFTIWFMDKVIESDSEMA